MNKFLWIGLTIAIVLGALWQFAPLKDGKDRMDALPVTGIGYQAKSVPLESYEKDLFADVHVLKRIYTIGNQAFFVTVLDGTHNRHIVHDPYYCFKGGGWDIVKEKNLDTENGKASLILIRKEGKEREALFLFSDGQKNFNSPLQYWLTATLRRVSLGASGQEPLLIVVQPLHDEPVDWASFQKKLNPLFNL